MPSIDLAAFGAVQAGSSPLISAARMFASSNNWSMIERPSIPPDRPFAVERVYAGAMDPIDLIATASV
jgi:hypothetical protein